MRSLLVGWVILTRALLPLQGQEASARHSPFGCSAGAVQAAWNRTPPLRIKQLSGLPYLHFEGHEFHFPALGPFVVEIFLAATLSEAVGGGPAKLHIYAETIDSANDPQARQAQWWEVESTEEGPAEDIEKSSASLLFDSERIQRCYTGDQCGFADVALATPDPNVPLIVIKFGENLGGANALNWTEASILLDFRPTPPRVLATLDCAYNEGGGACSGPDSAEMPRTEVLCDWKSESQDFLCSDAATHGGSGYLDFFLSSDKPAPLRPHEVATLADAIGEFRSKGIASPVKVRGIGPVSWVDEVRLNSGGKLIVLGSDAAFFAMSEFDKIQNQNPHPVSANNAETRVGQPGFVDSGLGSPIRIEPHPLIVDPNEVSRPSHRIDTPGWTTEKTSSFRSRVIYRGKDVTVLQVVEGETPESRELYWLGIQGDGAAMKTDAITLVGGAHYAWCGNSSIPENVATVEKITKPFEATVRVRPAMWYSEAGDDGWEPLDAEKQTINCIRSGNIVWNGDKFRGSMEGGDCRSAQKPKDILVGPDGKLGVNEHPANPPR